LQEFKKGEPMHNGFSATSIMDYSGIGAYSSSRLKIEIPHGESP